ncbi:uncharacterized protein F5147DRAFT_648200 [Suillus discolor]|uniref:Uncharacterized protein n=1 Tax=Suillus discolor TaxID=1912936 RepID=A0A9P7JZQ2_9AGAM|nr:uncharacterized protein F5147DRAFT_648200 [Suillus discolor]KAG2119149.1 hypothetical protein F5147DRAFT_648200 [Suillus discolor]
MSCACIKPHPCRSQISAASKHHTSHPRKLRTVIIWKNYLIPTGVAMIGNHWSCAVCTALISGFSLMVLAVVCPGQHIMNWSVFINMALILWASCLLENPALKINTLAFSDITNIRAALFEFYEED